MSGTPHPEGMYLPGDASTEDPVAQRLRDRRRVLRAAVASGVSVMALIVVFALQGAFDVVAWTVGPHAFEGLRGVLTAPLLHGSPEHLLSNALALLLLGTLAGSVYPRATLRAIPLAWIGSGLGAWLLGDAGSHHLGASGVVQGLAYLVVVLGLLRRDRPAIAAAMIALTFSGGMLVAVLPHDPQVSWQSHLGGAIGGIVAAWRYRALDPPPMRQRYSWEFEDETLGDDQSSSR